MDTPALYFRKYRQQIGLDSQQKAKEFLSAKDIRPSINYEYVEALNDRIVAIIAKINDVICSDVRKTDIKDFNHKHISIPYSKIKETGILPRLNNQGRRPEEVFFSWLRGYAICEYFTNSISNIFQTPLESIQKIGDDDFQNIDTFKRTPKADLEIRNSKKEFIRLEIQSGFQGINDIKQHKVLEARRIFFENQTKTIAVHFDLFNGQVAFLNLHTIEDTDMNWVTRQQMEGQTVFAIDQNFFKWRLLDSLPMADQLEIDWNA